MISKVLKVHNEEGLHARPAMEFAKLAAQYSSTITIEKEADEFDAKSMLMELSACICCGDQFVLKADGADEQAAMDSLERYIAAL